MDVREVLGSWAGAPGQQCAQPETVSSPTSAVRVLQ